MKNAMALCAGIKLLSIAILLFGISIAVNDAKKVSCTIFCVRNHFIRNFMHANAVPEGLFLSFIFISNTEGGPSA